MLIKILNFISVALFIFSFILMLGTCGMLDTDRITIARALFRMVIGFGLVGFTAILQTVVCYLKQEKLKEDKQ